MTAGCVTITTFNLDYSYRIYLSRIWFTTETTTFPPETTILKDNGESKYLHGADSNNLDDIINGIKSKTFNGIKYNKNREAQQAAIESFKDKFLRISCTEIISQEEERVKVPIAHSELQKAFALARAGYDVTLTSQRDMSTKLAAIPLKCLAAQMLHHEQKVSL